MLITIALPYINNILHIGHIYEMYISNLYYILIKKYTNCKIITGLDCHGLIKKNNILKIEFLNKKKIRYFNFFFNQKKTNSFINTRITNWIFIILCDKNKIYNKQMFRFFNEKKNFFIPDKYIKKICKICKIEIEYYCLNCNKKYYFYKIKKIKNISIKKINSFFLKNYLINDWDFSRNKIYCGIRIISKKNIFFYVWYDAIVSYISNNIFYFNKFKKILNFIGKDIIYFHIIFNIILKILNYNKSKIYLHGFINYNKKISKSNKIKIPLINKNLIKFFFLLNIKNDIKDIKYNIKNIKLNFKKNFLNKIINFYFRLKKFFILFDNKINFFFIKNNYYNYYLLKKINLNNIINNNLNFIFKLNKIINLNKFWGNKNLFLNYYYNSKIFFNYINIINFFLKLINTRIKKKIFKNYKIFKIKKI
ncbi:methionyl-tRNA synthetase [Candidatus Carsonella ruddii HT isolate Thao2000]|uniref:Methionyl-tRNA synthetase n=1 Tax=Candidatus Carsonella ruddii HT isolate Thao2000 TaxID=1202539 RepID=J3TWB9_CARRU|nr:class I tRNA ligase family protein [Candidatus Carsonella ruddii]AFP84150.1 methionyl-tRNA synthetase [Candidatus Carsonella ruddii HT isolate Thao2000]